MEHNLPKFIDNLSNEELKVFFDKFKFEDYDFEKHDNYIDLRIFEKDKIYEYTLTDYKVYGKDIKIANALTKRFSEFLSEEFGAIYQTAKKLYFIEQSKEK